MTRETVRGSLTALALLALGCAAHSTPATTPPPGGTASPAAAATPTATPRRFDFQVGFWVNLHQRLYAESGPRPPREPLHAPSAAEQSAWDGAVEQYRQRYPDRGLLALLTDDELLRANRELAALADGAEPGAGLPTGLRAALVAAAPVYRQHRWPLDERADRDFITRLAPLLARFGPGLDPALARAYATPWPIAPIRVDVARYAGPVGAYTTVAPTPHITIASSDPRHAGEAALEILLHEASHVLVGPIERSIARACAAQRKPVPPTLWHAVLFYTTGELVRRQLGPGYTPYALRNGLYTRGPDWAAYEPLLARLVPAYLDGHQSLDTTIDELVAALPAPPF